MNYEDLDKNYLDEELDLTGRNDMILSSALLNIADAWVGTGIQPQWPDTDAWLEALKTEHTLAILGAIALNPVSMVQIVFRDSPDSVLNGAAEPAHRFTEEVKACLEEFRITRQYTDLFMAYSSIDGYMDEDHWTNVGSAFCAHLHGDELDATINDAPDALFDNAFTQLGYNIERWFKLNVIEREIPKTVYCFKLTVLLNMVVAYEGAVIMASTESQSKEESVDMLADVSALGLQTAMGDPILSEMLFGDAL